MIDKTCGNCKHAGCNRMSYMDDAACPAWTDRAASVEQVARDWAEWCMSIDETTRLSSSTACTRLAGRYEDWQMSPTTRRAARPGER